MFKSQLVFCFVYLFVAGPIAADTRISYKFHLNSYVQFGVTIPAADTYSTIWLGTGRIRLDYPPNIGFYTIFLADSNSWFTVYPKFEIYSKGQPFEVALAGGHSDSLKLLEGMKLIEPEIPELNIQTVKSNETNLINGFPCQKFAVTMSDSTDTTTVEVWTDNDVKIDFNLLNQVKFERSPLGGKFDKLGEHVRRVAGLQVLTIASTTMFSGAVTTMEITELKDLDAPAGYYDLPKGYELYPAPDSADK